MPQNTYKDDLGPAAGVYEYVYCIAALSPLTDTQAPYVIFFFLLSPWREQHQSLSIASSNT